MINVPGDDVDVSEFSIRYDPSRCSIFPAKWYTMGFQIVDTAVVAKLMRLAKRGSDREFYSMFDGMRVHA